jgi:hypothetical protein
LFVNGYEEHNLYAQVDWGDESKFCFRLDPKFLG